MATPIKETPLLYGKDATTFLNEVAENEKCDHSAAYQRAKAAYDRIMNGESLFDK